MYKKSKKRRELGSTVTCAECKEKYKTTERHCMSKCDKKRIEKGLPKRYPSQTD